MIIKEHRFIIINMFVIIEFYHSGVIQSLVDGHTFCITVLEPIAFNYDFDSLGNTSLSLCWCRYAQVLPLALS